MTHQVLAKHLIIARDFAFPPERVFSAFATSEAKFAWFGGGDAFKTEEYRLDFRTGGSEYWRGYPHGREMLVTNDTHIVQVIADVRIIIAYTMWINEAMITSSLQTLEFSGKGGGTHLKLSEQIVYLDDWATEANHEGRIAGTEGMLDRLSAWLDGGHS